RLVALVGLAIAAAAAFVRPLRRAGRAAWASLSPIARLCAGAALGALAWALVAGLASSRRLPALDALRASLLLGLALPLGASRVVARRGRLLAGVFLAACAVDAVVSVAQSRGWYQPFDLVAVGMRDVTGAFVGNVRYLATALALCAVLALAILLPATGRPLRIAAAVLLGLFVAGLAVNQNLTALSAALAGFTVALAARFGRRAVVPILAGAAAVALLVAAYPPLRTRAVEA